MVNLVDDLPIHGSHLHPQIRKCCQSGRLMNVIDLRVWALVETTQTTCPWSKKTYELESLCSSKHPRKRWNWGRFHLREKGWYRLYPWDLVLNPFSRNFGQPTSIFTWKFVDSWHIKIAGSHGKHGGLTHPEMGIPQGSRGFRSSAWGGHPGQPVLCITHIWLRLCWMFVRFFGKGSCWNCSPLVCGFDPN